MINFESILLLIALIGVFFGLKYKGIFHKIISLGILLSAIIGLIVPFVAILLSLILAILTGIYGFRLQSSDLLLKITVGLMGFLFATVFMISIQHLPGANIFRIILELPVLLYIFHMIRNRRMTKEFSFMIVWLFLAISYFIGIFI